MKIVTSGASRRFFFFALFAWFCVVTTVRDAGGSCALAGNWLLQLDPRWRSAAAHHPDGFARSALGIGTWCWTICSPFLLRLGVSVRRVASLIGGRAKNMPSAWP